MDTMQNNESLGAQPEGISRRQLIKGVGLVTVSTGLLAGLPLTSVGAATAKAKKGGTLRIGVVGSTNDIIDGQAIVAKADQARLVTGWESLMTFDPNFAPTTNYGLAESVKVLSTTKAVVKLRKGLKFSNGKAVTADDVIYSWQRLLDPKLALPTYKAATEFYDPSMIKKIDSLTVEFTMKKPTIGFETTLAAYVNSVVPVGYTREGPQIGTGPYKLKSFTPGRESVHVRNPYYWRKGKPSFDTVIIQDFGDKPALVNALLSGQIDAAVDIPLTAIPQIQSNSNLTINEVNGGGWLCITMQTDVKPFDDVRVRQALRLIIDRQEILARALGGHGEIGNDLFGKVDPLYNANKFPQRTQDIAKAVALLNAAGFTKEKPLEFELAAPDDTGGLIPLVQAFAEHCKKTDGVVKCTPKAMDATYWDTVYAKVGIFTSFWSPRAYLSQIGTAAGYGETNLEKTNKAYNDIYVQASGEPDLAKRTALVKQLQKIEYEEGGFIIPCFNAFADAYSTKLKGVVKGRASSLNMDYYGHGFQEFSF
jgi:peptide/nickel transport system substrate-binding protein